MDEDTTKIAEGEEESVEEMQPLKEEDNDKDDNDSNSDDEEPLIEAVGCLIVR